MVTLMFPNLSLLFRLVSQRVAPNEKVSDGTTHLFECSDLTELDLFLLPLNYYTLYSLFLREVSERFNTSEMIQLPLSECFFFLYLQLFTLHTYLY